MTKTKEIKEIREIKSKVRIIKEIERENNKQESNFNEFLEIDRLRFLNARKKTLNKNKAGEKLDSIIDDESIKDENKAREDLERNRENMGDRNNEPRNIYSRNEDNSVYNVKENKEEGVNVRYSTESPSNSRVGFIKENETRDRNPNEPRYSVSEDERQDNRRRKTSQFG